MAETRPFHPQIEKKGQKRSIIDPQDQRSIGLSHQTHAPESGGSGEWGGGGGGVGGGDGVCV